MFGEVLERFIQNRPVAVMVRILLESFLNAAQLDRWFDTVRQIAIYQGTLVFVDCRFDASAWCANIRPSVHSAYRHSDIEASVVALYGKLQHLEPTTSQGLVRYIAGEAEALIQNMGGTTVALLPGYRVKFLDGNCIEATEHRLEVLRGTRAGALPGKALVVFDPQLGLAVDVFPSEDGHAQERSLLSAVANTIHAREVWIADRNFCVLDFCGAFPRKIGVFRYSSTR